MNVRRALILFFGLVGLLIVVTLWRADYSRVELGGEAAKGTDHEDR